MTLLYPRFLHTSFFLLLFFYNTCASRPGFRYYHNFNILSFPSLIISIILVTFALPQTFTHFNSIWLLPSPYFYTLILLLLLLLGPTFDHFCFQPQIPLQFLNSIIDLFRIYSPPHSALYSTSNTQTHYKYLICCPALFISYREFNLQYAL